MKSLTNFIKFSLLAAMALVLVGCGSLSGSNNVSAADLQKRQQAMAASDRLIVPGQRIGPIHLGMGMDEVVATLGQPDIVQNPGRGQYWEYFSLNLAMFFSASSAPEVVQVSTHLFGKNTLATIFKTANGVGLGATSFDVKRAYSSYTDNGNTERMYYDSIGILFDLQSDYRIWAIAVFPRSLN
jgi:hypothetical protein